MLPRSEKLKRPKCLKKATQFQKSQTASKEQNLALSIKIKYTIRDQLKFSKRFSKINSELIKKEALVRVL